MAAFKAHCSLGFWKGGRPIAQEAAGPRDKAMGQFGRIESLADLPKAAALRKLIVEARAAWAAAIDDKASAPPAPTVPVTPAPEPVVVTEAAETESADRPRKTGWWSRRFAGG